MSNRPGQPPAVHNEALARARYFAYAQRRSMPPRCNFVGILIMVLAIGMLFIGITMTLIANWPGATSIGENPLYIAGPALLGVGGGVFVLAIVLAVCLNRRERNRWEQKLTNLAAERVGSASRENVGSQQPLTQDKPFRLSQTDDEKLAYGGRKDDPSSSRSSSAYAMKGRPSVEMNPDPSKKTNGKFQDVSLDSNDQQGSIPEAMRVQKKRRERKSDSEGSTNQSYSSDAGGADLGVPGMGLIPAHRRPPDPPTAYSNAVYAHSERVTPEPRHEQKTQRRGEDDRRRRKEEEGLAGSSSYPIRDAISRGTSQIYSNGDEQQQQQQQQHLRVHIKAQPGTAVHITPTATPPHSRRSNQLPVRSSAHNTASDETEI